MTARNKASDGRAATASAVRLAAREGGKSGRRRPSSTPDEFLQRRTWRAKFGDAFRGAKRGIRGESSFFVHFFIAAVVIASAIVLDVTLIEWCILLLCIAMVLAAEMFNTALEWMAKAISRERNSQLGAALDIGSAAVLTASLGAAIVGAIVFIHRIGALVGWW